ncbi:MAG: COX15/CtaA family protein [Acidobacteriota bacterium]|nr:COX15/CtaA family protein [Acidobacteriota bacterium]
MSDFAASPAVRNRLLGRFAWFAVFYNVLVILWGALVRATGSGAGCGNHWPLCNGQVIPVSPGIHTIIEFTHRMMTGGSTFIVLALLVWTFRATAKGQAARWFAVASTVLLLNEALLGALLVKLGYVTDNQSAGRMVVLSIHLSNTLLLVAALTLTARFLTTLQRTDGLVGAPGFGWAIAGLMATVGVGVSGSMAALGDTLFPATSLRAAYLQDFGAASPWLLRLRLVHPVSAVVAAIFVIWLVRRSSSARESGPPGGRTPFLAKLTAGLLVSQFALGLIDVLLLAPAWMQLVHLLGADLYWVALVLLAAETVWPVVTARVELPSGSATTLA